MIFGSKSEKLKGQLEQLEFQLEELETEQAATEAAQLSSAPTTTKSRPCAPRKPLPEDLAREIIHASSRAHLLSGLWWCAASVRGRCIRATGTHSGYLQGDSTCAAEVRLRGLRTGSGSTCSGTADRSRLAGPQPVGACAGIEVRRSFAVLYRQSEIYAREGIDLSRSTLAGWVGAASELLAPLVDQIRSHVMAGSKTLTPMTPPFQCSLPATARPRRPVGGPMWVMIGLPAIGPHRRCGLHIPKIVRANIRASI